MSLFNKNTNLNKNFSGLSQFIPSYEEASEVANKQEKLSAIINKYEISEYFSNKLHLLNSFRILFIFDDSGSMKRTLNDSPLNTKTFKATRWDELKYFAEISIEIANLYNQNGTDFYFLNRPMIKQAKNFQELKAHFFNLPSGYTPIANVLRKVLSSNSSINYEEKKLLILIVTDGEPTDDKGKVDIKDFKSVLKSRNNNTFCSIVSCTDEDDAMNYLNNWDQTIPRLDVVDDYRREKKEMQKAMGKDFSFSFGDYLVKSLIGSIDSALDSLDEK